jgi:hypothetical protein
MRTALVLSLSAFFVLASACSSSSTGDNGSNQDKGDVGTDADAAPATDSGVAETVSLDDGSTDDTNTPGGDANVDTAPPTNKCAGVTCTGAYEKCCASTGACYDTRYGVCY